MNTDAPFAVHSLSRRLTRLEGRLSRTALTWIGLALGLVACALPFALRGLFLLVRADSWPAYVLLTLVASALVVGLSEVNYFGRSWYLTLLYAASATALMIFCWNRHTADVLEARGRWSEVTVVEVTERPRSGPVCELRRTGDGAAVPRLLDDCADLAPGDTLRVLEDPEGEVRPQRAAPGAGGVYGAAGGAGAVLLATTVVAFRRFSAARTAPLSRTRSPS
ncbi:hypothetical protein [Streptomyces sp. G1]|uniref:hypothetical protein n=1 Tax=Streptomyces sp. G1 TaxID=361572 RepID=UPI00202FC18A|nr:hypothetical protein [Streptomyces sp. G1]MCM1970681.1 hypothetical protein [Streptomyces sp. G1]